MPFRVKIISPIKIDEADLRRRQIRYSEYAGSDTQISVFNLSEGPSTLDTAGDILFCEHAVFQEGMRTNPSDFDAILIDCVFDPALIALREQCPVPTFGPMKATLPMVMQIASNFSYIARAERQTLWLAETAARYGYKPYMASAQFLGISYEQSRNPQTFDEAMMRELRHGIQDNGAEAIVMGSTTMALSEQVTKTASGIPLFMPGMVALRVMEHLWMDGFLA